MNDENIPTKKGRNEAIQYYFRYTFKCNCKAYFPYFPVEGKCPICKGTGASPLIFNLTNEIEIRSCQDDV